jgi:hypothetical protein
VLVVISPELVRSVRVLAGCLIPLAAFGVVILGARLHAPSLHVLPAADLGVLLHAVASAKAYV